MNISRVPSDKIKKIGQAYTGSAVESAASFEVGSSGRSLGDRNEVCGQFVNANLEKAKDIGVIAFLRAVTRRCRYLDKLAYIPQIRSFKRTHILSALSRGHECDALTGRLSYCRRSKIE